MNADMKDYIDSCNITFFTKEKVLFVFILFGRNTFCFA